MKWLKFYISYGIYGRQEMIKNSIIKTGLFGKSIMLPMLIVRSLEVFYRTSFIPLLLSRPLT
jgi:hypothetical protein